MNYQKLDPELAFELAEISDAEDPAFTVFIRTLHAPAPDEATYLKALGISGVTPGRRIFTATLSAHEVEELSEQPWVRSLELTRKLQLLDTGNSSS